MPGSPPRSVTTQVRYRHRKRDRARPGRREAFRPAPKWNPADAGQLSGPAAAGFVRVAIAGLECVPFITMRTLPLPFGVSRPQALQINTDSCEPSSRWGVKSWLGFAPEGGRMTSLWTSDRDCTAGNASFMPARIGTGK